MLFFSFLISLFLQFFVVGSLGATPVAQAAVVGPTYDIGSPTVRDVWVDPTNGNDANDGLTRNQALRSISAAWNTIPGSGMLSGTGYRIQLVAGSYGETTLPAEGALFGKHGTAQYPIIIQSADGTGTARITRPLNIQDNAYLYLIGLRIESDPPGGNIVQLANTNHVLLRNVQILGGNGPSQSFKGNQLHDAYFEGIEVSGGDITFDLVSGHTGHIVRSSFHDGGDWCLYLKGGTSGFRVEGNRVYNCRGAGGISAGNGTGFDYMERPWIHHELYATQIVNNTVWHVNGSGIGVFGGYNVLIAHNTFYDIATSQTGHGLITVGYGGRPCAGDEEYAPGACRANHDAGGWGHASASEGDQDWVPNAHVWIMNNIFANTPSAHTRWSHLVVYGPVHPPSDVNLPSIVHADTDLRIKGNVIWNPGQSDLGISDETGCDSGNPSCSASRITTENAINTIEPRFTNAGSTDFHITNGTAVLAAPTVSLPSFSWSDAPTPPTPPATNLANTVSQDADGSTRSGINAGAYAISGASAPAPSPTPTPAPSPSPTPTPAPSPTPTPSPTPPRTNVGRLIKLSCPWYGSGVNHPCKAVYYLDSNGTRHAFPNERVYFTWYSDFSNVSTVSDSEMASYPIGRNVTYRPGVKMVKFTTVNRVYAVDLNSTLRWVPTEELAVTLYGTSWNTKIDDISDAFYGDYRFGADITSQNPYTTDPTRQATPFP